MDINSENLILQGGEVKHKNANFEEVMGRLKQALGVSQDKVLALKLGMKPSTFAERKRGGKAGVPSIPTDRVLELAKLESLNPAWVFDGKEPMRMGEAEAEFERKLSVIRHATELAQRVPGLSEEERSIVQEVIIGVDACSEVQVRSALSRCMGVARMSDFFTVKNYENGDGATGVVGNVNDRGAESVAFNFHWIQTSLGLSPDDLILMDVRGDSMSPTMNCGDCVLLDAKINKLISEGVYAVSVGGAVLIKRIRIKNSGTVVAMADNPKYGDEVIAQDELERLKVIGRVVWHGRKL